MSLVARNKYLRELLLVGIFLLGILGIVASGGGGGGGGPTSISYAGNTDPAFITRANAARLVGNVLIGQTIVGSSSGGVARSDISINTPSRGIGLAQFPGRLTQKLRNTMQTSPDFASRSATVRARTDLDEIEPCDNNGGSIHITGFLEDNGTGTLTLDYINCREGGDTLDGTVTAQINAFDFGFLLPTDAIYSFSVLTLTNSTFNVSLDGSIHSQISIGVQTEQLTVDRLVARNNATGEMLMITNQVSIIAYDNIFSPSSLSATIIGRIYDSTHGYVDFTTIGSIIFSTITQEYPDRGQLLLTGSLNSGILVTVISDTYTLLDFDLDGDATYETAATVSWLELESEQDLADSDGDRMHDSWETAYGLDPFDPNDALLDADGDGVSNYQEYLDHTHPTAELDQSFMPSSSASYQTNIIYNPLDPSYVDQAQTFTVGITGQLINVEVLINGFSQVADLLVDVRPTINGVPTSDDSAILGEARISASETTGSYTFISADFSSQNMQVASGSKLAIVLKIDRSIQGGDYGWRGETGDLYTSGVAYTRTSTSNWNAITTVDTGFKTFVRAAP